MDINEKYNEIFGYIKKVLGEDNISTKLDNRFPFRNRSEHIWRVFIWAKRLIENKEYENINKDALLIASLFHDVGYSISPQSANHAQNSEIVFQEYCKKNDNKIIDEEFIAYLIKNHSNKELMKNNKTPIEMILLMEADMLDETGAMSIVWDSMAEGNKEIQSYKNTLNRIRQNSIKTLETNPMITEDGKQYWKNKQETIKYFIKEYTFELGIEE